VYKTAEEAKKNIKYYDTKNYLNLVTTVYNYTTSNVEQDSSIDSCIKYILFGKLLVKRPQSNESIV
jgi:hypothetical protein